MENAHDLDHLRADVAIHDEMPPSAALAGDVEATKGRENFIARGAPGYVRARVERRQRFDQRGLVDRSLTFAERVGGVFHDACKILFSLDAEANMPLGVGHLTPAPEIAALPSCWRWVARVGASGNSLNSPLSRAATPICAAARRAESLAASSASRFSIRRRPSRMTSLAF